MEAAELIRRQLVQPAATGHGNRHPLTEAGGPGEGSSASRNALSELNTAIFQPILQAHQDVASAFDTLASPWTRKAVSKFIAGEQVAKVETAIEKQVSRAKAALNVHDEETKRDALSKIEEGMGYWKAIIMRKMNGR